MHHYPKTGSEFLLPEIVAELALVRRVRGFDPAHYLDAKVALVVDYLRRSKLSALVLGLSGGIDSAVVLGIALEAQRRHPDVIKQVVPIAVPIHRAEYATHQAEALARADELCRHWGLKLAVYDLTEQHREWQRIIHAQVPLGTERADWAGGQLVAYLRTPAFYYTTSILTANGFPAIIAGTTNRDEGSYLGYVAKASDGMVDIQVIADLHKSEVNALARHLGVVASIVEVTPSGDMYDGRQDTDVFGAPYDFVELFLNHKAGNLLTGYSYFLNDQSWSEAAREQYQRMANNLEALHGYNAHKYRVGSPAVHLNVLPSAVPGGWKE